MLIRNAQLHFEGRVVDVRTQAGRIVQVGRTLAVQPHETVLEAHGGALLPGLHDHHVHLFALASSLSSLQCGPPHVHSASELAACLQRAAQESRQDWLRGVGYHQSVAGDIERSWLDRYCAERPVRIQHRSGRLWILNSAAVQRLEPIPPDAPLERLRGRYTGRLFDGDAWLRERLAGQRPSLFEASRLLASRGVVGVTEMTPSVSLADFHYLAGAQERGELLQSALVFGDDSLDGARDTHSLQRGGRKIHLHEATLPRPEVLRDWIIRSHAEERPVAIHCATLGELVFALDSLAAAGPHPLDRIEHASVTPDSLLEDMRKLGVTVVTQPGFVFERGDQYLQDIPPDHWPWMYRVRAFRVAGVSLATGTDAPFGTADPWLAMQAAVDRRTRCGEVLGADEAITPEEAFGLFTGDPHRPGQRAASLGVGAPGNLCLLDAPWSEVRERLNEARVTATIRAGAIVWTSKPTCEESTP